MLITYGMAEENIRAAVRLYAERFPGREHHPGYNVFLRCIRRARETGSLLPHRRLAGVPAQCRVIDEERILQAFEENPGNSVRRVARTLGLSRSAVHRVLRRNGLHPFHYQRVQQLIAGDEEQRVYYCEGIFIIFI
jgi:transcriptional regulator with GAF, ATPase, and Fis domain